MAKANFNVANLHDRDPERISAQKPIPSDLELDTVKEAAFELNQTFTALERLLKEHELEGSAIAMPSHLLRPLAQRAKNLSGGIISILDGSGSPDSLDGQRRIG